MKQNILYPFLLEKSDIKSQSIAVELAKNLDVDLHLLVLCKNNNFLYNEHIECSKTQEESAHELFDNLKKRYSDIILNNEKQVGNRHGTKIDISFKDCKEAPLHGMLSDNYLWIFDYQDFMDNIIPNGFNDELSKFDRKVWIISKNRSSILTQTKQLEDQYFFINRKHQSNTLYLDALPLDVM